MKRLAFSLALLGLALSGCQEAIDTTKDVANKGGELVGETMTEFGDGVASGVENALAIEVELSDSLESRGLSFGQISLDASSWEASDNVLEVYVIFDQDFSDTLSIRAYNESGLEIGRAREEVSGTAGDASYFDFTFDERTNLDSDSRLVMDY